MIRLASVLVIVLAALAAASLLLLPVLAGRGTAGVETQRPEALPDPVKPPETRSNPLVPASDLREQLRLPRVDASPQDEHTQASLAAHTDGDYETAFEEAVLALDPRPLAENKLYQTLTSSEQSFATVEKPSGRRALDSVDEALRAAADEAQPPTVGRLNNAAAMMILYYSDVDTEIDSYAGWFLARELAFQAADRDPSHCPALLNLTLLYGSVHATGSENLQPAGGASEPWTDYYPIGGCKDPALLYYLIQVSISPPNRTASGVDLSPSLGAIDDFRATPGWNGIAHGLRGDAYYWQAVYSGERTQTPRVFEARHYFELALDEYAAALALQPDDPSFHHGRALAYMGLKDFDAAVDAAQKATQASPSSAGFVRTLVQAHAANGDHAEAAEVNRGFLAQERSPRGKPTVLFYSPPSHGSESYSELRLPGEGGAALLDSSELIPRYDPRPYNNDLTDSQFDASHAGNLESAREERQHYELLRDDLLSGDQAAFEQDLADAPQSTKEDWHTLLLEAAMKLPDRQTDATAEDFQEAFSETPYSLYPQAAYSLYPAGLSIRDEDLVFRETANLFRQHARYEDAARVYRLWRERLEESGADDGRRAEVESLLGQTLFLQEDLQGSLARFERAVELRPEWPIYGLNVAFLHEQLGDYDEAVRGYRAVLEDMDHSTLWKEDSESPGSFYYPHNYHAARHLGDVLLTRAETFRNADEAGIALRTYDEAIEAYRDALSFPRGSETASTSAAANNLGIALLMREKARDDSDYEDSIRVFGTLTGSEEPPASWNNPPASDERNPIFHLNLGWAYESNGQPGEAREEYLAAVKADPTFHPALNDLGVLAARDGDLEGARDYFGAALKATDNDYDYAAHNMGVTLLESGPVGFLAAQHYLARAASLNSSFSDTAYDYALDNELYFLDLSLGEEVPPDWEFVVHAERSTFVVSSLAVLLLLIGIVRRTTVARGRDALIGRVFQTGTSRFGGRIATLTKGLGARWLSFMRFGTGWRWGWWATPLALTVSAPAVAVVQGWSLLKEPSAVKLMVLGGLIYVAAVSLLVHHAGHAAAALRHRLRVRETPWPAGIAQSLVLAAIGGPAVSPVPTTSVDGKPNERGEADLVYLAGPVVSVAFAILLYAVYTFSTVPLLKFGVVLNLGLASASLLSVPPLEGVSLSQGRYAGWTFWLTTGVAVLTALIAIQIL